MNITPQSQIQKYRIISESIIHPNINTSARLIQLQKEINAKQNNLRLRQHPIQPQNSNPECAEQNNLRLRQHEIQLQNSSPECKALFNGMCKFSRIEFAQSDARAFYAFSDMKFLCSLNYNTHKREFFKLLSNDDLIYCFATVSSHIAISDLPKVLMRLYTISLTDVKDELFQRILSQVLEGNIIFIGENHERSSMVVNFLKEAIVFIQSKIDKKIRLYVEFPCINHDILKNPDKLNTFIEHFRECIKQHGIALTKDFFLNITEFNNMVNLDVIPYDIPINGINFVEGMRYCLNKDFLSKISIDDANTVWFSSNNCGNQNITAIRNALLVKILNEALDNNYAPIINLVLCGNAHCMVSDPNSITNMFKPFYDNTSKSPSQHIYTKEESYKNPNIFNFHLLTIYSLQSTN